MCGLPYPWGSLTTQAYHACYWQDVVWNELTPTIFLGGGQFATMVRRVMVPPSNLNSQE